MKKRNPRLDITAGPMSGPELVAGGRIAKRVKHVTYVTARCRYNMTVGAVCVRRDQIDYEPGETLKGCEQCVNVYNNYGCPPYSPKFEGVKPSADRMVIGWARMHPEEMLKVNPKLPLIFQMSSTECLLLNLVHRVALSYRAAHGGYYLGAGGCRHCKPCALKRGEPKCAHPDKRVFSLEATGVRVDKLMAKIGEPLEWRWAGEDKPIPPMAHVIGILGHSRHPSRQLTRWMLGKFLMDKSIERTERT